MVEYTLPPMPPISGLIASSLDSPLDENDDTVPAVGDETISLVSVITTSGTFPAAISFRIAAPASLEVNAEGMKLEPNIFSILSSLE
jgi:hypothetical protein